MIKISVILSIFNTGKYLQKCLESIISQTLTEIEIICVNDGSYDNSLIILNEYAQKDSRIQIITQERQGAAVSRNNGIKLAKGKYLSILDSDDFFDKNMLEKLYAQAEKTAADIVLCGCDYYDDLTLKRTKASWSLVMELIENKKVFSKIDIPESIFQITAPNAFTKLFRHDFILENGIWFQNLPSCNDLAFTYSALLLAGRISTVNESLISYRSNNTSSISKKRGETSYCVVKAYQEVLNRINLEGSLKDSFYKRVLSSFSFEYNLCNPLHKENLLALYKDFLTDELWREFLTTYNIKYESPRRAKKAEVKVSVIVPVYNVEQYLHKCIKSITEQTFNDIEIICINDGSDDGSVDIIMELAQKDSRIVVLNKKNRGLSAARNAGLDEAMADYILFIDADDYILSNTIEKLYDAMINNDVDLTMCSMESFVEDSSLNERRDSIQEYYDKTMPKTGLHKLYSMRDFRSSACAKLFKKSIIDKYNMRFPEGLINEDEAWQWYYLCRMNSYYAIDEKLYMRLIRDGSIMSERDFNYKNPTDFINVLKNIYEYLDKNNLFHFKRDEFQSFFNLQCHVVLDRYPIQIQREGLKLAKKVANECGITLYYKEKGFLQKIFCVQKDSKHYVIKILGISIKLRYNELL